MTTPAERTEAVKPDWHDLPTEPGLWLLQSGVRRNLSKSTTMQCKLHRQNGE